LRKGEREKREIFSRARESGRRGRRGDCEIARAGEEEIARLRTGDCARESGRTGTRK